MSAIANVRRLRYAAALYVCVLSGSVWAGWPVIEPPPGASVEWVGDDMKLNGVPMQIRRFTSGMSVTEVMAFYRDRWKERLSPVENTVGEWRIIGRQSGDFYLTVQAKKSDSSGSEGFLGVSRLPAVATGGGPVFDTRFPKMEGTEVVSDVDSNDKGKLGKTLILKNDYSVQSNASYYQSVLPTQGWKRNEGYGGIRGDKYLLYFQRREEAASIVIAPHPDRGTAIVVNMVSNGS